MRSTGSKTMRISVRIDSKAAQAQLRRWGGEFREKVQKAVARGIASEAAELKQDVRSHVAGQMTVVKKSFVKGFTAKVLDKDRSRLPALTAPCPAAAVARAGCGGFPGSPVASPARCAWR